MKRILLTAVVCLWAGFASAATWNTVRNQDCTGARAATVTLTAGTTQATVSAQCCTAAGVGTCNERQNFGSLFEVMVTLVGNGTYGATDLIDATQFQRTGLNSFVYALCNPVVNNAEPPGAVMFPVLRRTTQTPPTTRPTVQLWTATAAEVAGSVAGFTLNCLFFGR